VWGYIVSFMMSVTWLTGDKLCISGRECPHIPCWQCAELVPVKTIQNGMYIE
jgi:hypothetical protein